MNFFPQVSKSNIFTNLTFYFLLSTFFFQTRFAFFARYQTVDYLIPFIYLSDVLIVLLLLSMFIFHRQEIFDRLRKQRTNLPAGKAGNKEQRIKKSVFCFLFSVFLVSTAISNLSAIHPISAWYHWFKLLEFGLFAFWVAYFIKAKSINNKQPTIINLLSLGLAFQCFIAIFEFVLQRSLGLQILGEWRFSILTPGIAKVILFGKEFLRPYATFPHPNVLGGILAIMAPINLHLAIAEALKRAEAQKNSASQRTSLRSQCLQVFSFFLFTFVLFLTFSRSAWLAYGVLMMVVFMFWGRRGIGGIGGKGLMLGKRKILLFWLSAVCCLLSAVPFVYQRVRALQTTDVLSIERRVELNHAATSMFWEHPLFGVGLGNFVPNLEKYLTVSGSGRFLQPVHNVPLLILAETGIVGSITFSLFLGTLLYNFLRSRSTKHKAPNPKSQAPNKHQIQNHKLQTVLNFENWDLRFIWNLEFGTWNLIPILMWTGILVISLFDHYFWTLQAGQLFFWLIVGLTI